MTRDVASKGLLRLMIRLPALRGELQIIHGHDDLLQELAEAYEDATQMLSRLQANPRSERGLIREYEGICSGIEEEIVSRCAALRL
jgi:hypothetical protein